MTKKKYLDIRERLRSFDQDLFNGSIVRLMCDLQGFQDDYPDHTALAFVIDYDEYGVEVELFGTRKETDKERDKRLDKARKVRERNAASEVELEENERAELKRLQEKYNADSSYK